MLFHLSAESDNKNGGDGMIKMKYIDFIVMVGLLSPLVKALLKI
jgi:hypothetical protein